MTGGLPTAIFKEGTMKRLAIAVMALALVACDDDNPTEPSTTGPIVFTAQLRAQDEVPAITNAESAAAGTATITFNVPRDSAGNITGGGSVTFNVQMTGFPAGSVAQRAHIHPGAAGVNGGVLVDTTLAPGSPVAMPSGTGSFNLTNSALSQTQATDITANPAGFYFNVHTILNPNGAIRGQLVRRP
jgi:CHRD domain